MTRKIILLCTIWGISNLVPNAAGCAEGCLSRNMYRTVAECQLVRVKASFK